jgi:hypothetical protein
MMFIFLFSWDDHVPAHSTGKCQTGGVRTLEEADSFGADKVNEFLFEQILTGPLILPVPLVEGTW